MYDHIDRVLLEAFIKWRELKDNRKWLSIGQIFLANLMKWTSKVCLITCIGACGLGGAGMAAAETMAEVRYYKWSDGTVTREENDNCAWLARLISFTIFMFGVACGITAIVTLLLAYLFWVLSFVYLMKTDQEFELHYAEKLKHLQNQIIQLENEKPKSTDAGYLKVWNDDRDKKIADLKLRIRRLENLRELERAKRSKGKIIPDIADEPKFDEFLRDYITGFNEYCTCAGYRAVLTYLEDVSQTEKDRAKLMAEESKISIEEAEVKVKEELYLQYKEDLDMVKEEAEKSAKLEARAALYKLYKGEACSEDETMIIQEIQRLNSKV